MALTEQERKLLNNATPGTARAKLGDKLDAVDKQGVAVPNAAGATPTKAEFDALLTSLRDAGLLAT